MSGSAIVPEYLDVTEISGEKISRQQLEHLVRRYRWAGEYAMGKDVIEAACGSGTGLPYLKQCARSVVGGDVSQAVLSVARRNLGDRVDLRVFDALDMPFSAASADVIILFEAIYYLPSADKFIEECARVLRPGGVVLIATANKDLFDFNPSPHSREYYGVVELGRLLARHGFTPKFFAAAPVDEGGVVERVLRPVKKLAVAFNLVPKTMAGKKWLKRIVFGKLVEMPQSIADVVGVPTPPAPIAEDRADRRHKVIYCAGTLG